MNRLAELTQKLYILGQKENLLPIDENLMRALTIELYDFLSFKKEQINHFESQLIENSDSKESNIPQQIINHSQTQTLNEDEIASIFPIEEEAPISSHEINATVEENHYDKPAQIIDNQNIETEQSFTTTLPPEDESVNIFPLELEPDPEPLELNILDEVEKEPVTDNLHLKQLDESNSIEPTPEIPNFLKTNLVNPPPIFIPVEKVEESEPIQKNETISEDIKNAGISFEQPQLEEDKWNHEEDIATQHLPEIEIKNNVSPIPYKSQLGVNDTFILLNELFDNNRKEFDQFFTTLSQYHIKTDAIEFVKEFLSAQKLSNEDEILPIFEDIIQKA